MHHKRRRAKHQRAGCLLCKPSKLTANVKADRRRAMRTALIVEQKAYVGGT